MNIKVVVIIIASLAILGAGGILAYTMLNKQPTAPTTPSTTTPATNTDSTTTTTTSTTSSNSVLTADPGAESENSKKRFTAAQDKISQWSLWKKDAAFSGLFITFDAKLELNSANEIYVFDSPEDTGNHFTVSVSQSSGNMLRALIPVSDYQGELQPIKQEFWQSQYVDAIQFAQNNGGKAFMDQNAVTTIDAKLYRVPPKNFLNWVVVYHTKDLTKSLTVKMDAKDKTLVTD